MQITVSVDVTSRDDLRNLFRSFTPFVTTLEPEVPHENPPPNLVVLAPEERPRELAPIDVQRRQYQVLEVFLQRPGVPMHRNTIARRLSLPPPTVSNRLQQLKVQGLVTLIQGSWNWTLTAKARSHELIAV